MRSEGEERVPMSRDWTVVEIPGSEKFGTAVLSVNIRNVEIRIMWWDAGFPFSIEINTKDGTWELP